MRVLVNAISIKEGGSLVVLSRLLAAMIKFRPDIEWHAAVHPSLVDRAVLPAAVTPWTFSAIDVSPGHLLYWYELALPRLAGNLRADLLFSQTNYLPRRNLACPTLLLEQHAGHFCPDFKQLMERHLNDRAAIWMWRRKTDWVRNSVRKASRVVVQTLALARAISQQAGVPESRLDVVPHGPGSVSHAERQRRWPRRRTWRIGYVSKFGVQKDFGTALRALRELIARGRAVTLVLTLDKMVAANCDVERLASELGVRASLENLGELPTDLVQSLYDELDIFVFPSTSESFGFPLVEAMARGLPVAVARTASNLEVAGRGVPTFEPGDWASLASIVELMMNDPGEYLMQANRSAEAAKRYTWDRAAKGTLESIERTIVAQVRDTRSR